MSMAAGEYVSVSSQADTENADLARERKELEESPERELQELRGICTARGLDAELATRVAEQLVAKDALRAHARDELGLTDVHSAKPVQAAVASAATFGVGAALPLVAAALAPTRETIMAVTVSSLVFLAALGALSAGVGGSSRWRAVLRVTFWGALAMALTAVIGRLLGTVV
jgi:VIT1/CCC1 family predicted Fe2+/Mn2+ transporter